MQKISRQHSHFFYFSKAFGFRHRKMIDQILRADACSIRSSYRKAMVNPLHGDADFFDIAAGTIFIYNLHSLSTTKVKRSNEKKTPPKKNLKNIFTLKKAKKQMMSCRNYY